MKVEMTADGVMRVTAESSVEAFALRKWLETASVDVQRSDIGLNEDYVIRGTRFVCVGTLSTHNWMPTEPPRKP